MGELYVNRTDQKAIKEPVVSPEAVDRPYPDCPYLLLDVRDRDQYDRCHIISGMWQSTEVRSSGILRRIYGLF